MDVLFVCSGNTCRSPMAEGYLKSKNIKGINVSSAGFLSEGENPSEKAVSVMREIGIDISAHKSRLINSENISADKIFCMSDRHKSALIMAGVNGQKITVLSGGIPDPFGGSAEVYRECRDKIINAINTQLYSGNILPIKILPAGATDIKAIAELEKECFSSPWSERAIAEAFMHNTEFFKAVEDKKTVGYISVTAVAGEGYINNVAVAKEYRRKSIGTLLLDRAITRAQEKKLEFISLEVRASNKEAISLYEKAGFKKEGLRPDFYTDPKEDGIIMTRRFKNDNTGN